MRTPWMWMAPVLMVVGTSPAQERSAYSKDPAFFAKRASAFCDALASGELKRVLAFKAGGGADMPAEVRPVFQKIVTGLAQFFETPAGTFHRKVFAAFPRLTQLPEDLAWLEIEEQFRFRDPNADSFLHALSFELRFLWDDTTRAWIVERFQVEFESVDTVSGITTPQRDLVGASISAVMNGFASGASADDVLATARAPYTSAMLDVARATNVEGTGSGAATLSLSRAVKAKDLNALAARLGVPAEEVEGKQTVFETQLEAHPDLERFLRTFPVMSDLSRDVHRVGLRFAAPTIEGAIEILRGESGFHVSMLNLQPAGERMVRLPALLQRL
ncbi:MAG: hypothetical protein H6834_06985 [Planctomycetes bacterium]|nr:hypothetical protein [Planctomycetota bacterium]